MLLWWVSAAVAAVAAVAAIRTAFHRRSRLSPPCVGRLGIRLELHRLPLPEHPDLRKGAAALHLRGARSGVCPHLVGLSVASLGAVGVALALALAVIASAVESDTPRTMGQSWPSFARLVPVCGTVLPAPRTGISTPSTALSLSPRHPLLDRLGVHFGAQLSVTRATHWHCHETVMAVCVV